jgi:hypothetical protein
MMGKFEDSIMSKDNVEVFISKAIQAYRKKNLLVDAMFWAEAVRLLKVKLGEVKKDATKI